jgi:adenylate cyclase
MRTSKNSAMLTGFARRFGFARLFCLAILVALAALRVADVAFLEKLRLQTFDVFQVIEPRVATERPVIIVDIDEKSLARLGQWPWPRTRIADLVAALTKLDALVIGFDMIFAEPDRLSPGVAAGGLRNLSDTTRDSLLALPDNDQVLADELRKSVVVLGESGSSSPNLGNGEMQAPVGLVTLGDDPRPFLLSFPGLLSNIAVLSNAASGRGLLTVRTERDGIVRRVPMVLEVQGEVRPSLTLEMLRVLTGADTLFIKSDPTGIKSVAVKGVEVPTDRHGQLWVHFTRHDPARFVSAADVFDGKVAADTFSGKLVLVGTSAVGLLDVKTTPVEAVMPGVEVHAQILESALSGAVLVEPNYAIVAELAAALVLGIAVIWLTPIFNPLALLAFGVMLAALLVGASWYSYVTARVLFDFTYPLLSTLLIYMWLVFSSYFREQSQRRQIRSAFGRYLSPVLVEQLALSPEKLVLGGEEREMTIMFSDVRGFTGISEAYKHDPQGLTALMNRFLTPLTNAILARKGTIDKYMGDAILAFWNAPLDDVSHQINACEAALDMLDCIERLNRERKQEAKDSGRIFLPLNVGVGLNTGMCVVGNMGSDLRFDYSVLGDTVNLASRLEGQSKVYGFPILVASATARAAKDKFAIVETDFIAVKGRKEPEVVYAIAGRSDMANSERFQRLRNVMVEILASYRACDWDRALETIRLGRTLEGADSFATVFDLYEGRIAGFKAEPPGEDWNGVAVLQSK